jgi:peptidoglycan-N-acetylglucosamine deacetylase
MADDSQPPSPESSQPSKPSRPTLFIPTIGELGAYEKQKAQRFRNQLIATIVILIIIAAGGGWVWKNRLALSGAASPSIDPVAGNPGTEGTGTTPAPASPVSPPPVQPPGGANPGVAGLAVIQSQQPVSGQAGTTTPVQSAAPGTSPMGSPPAGTPSGSSTAGTSSVGSTGTSAPTPPATAALPIDEPIPGFDDAHLKIKIVKSGSPEKKVVALTFDDGPHPRVTPQLLDVLKEHQVKATFFVLGNQVKMYGSVLPRILQEGHEIGNHTFSHRFLRGMSNENINKELKETQDLIEKASGFRPHLFRPPYGAYRPNTKLLFQEHGLHVVLWSVDPEDWRKRSKDSILNTVTNKVQPGSIVVLHDIYKSTVDALPEVITTLRSNGYEFATVSQLCGLTNILTTASVSAPAGAPAPVPAAISTSPVPTQPPVAPGASAAGQVAPAAPVSVTNAVTAPPPQAAP